MDIEIYKNRNGDYVFFCDLGEGYVMILPEGTGSMRFAEDFMDPPGGPLIRVGMDLSSISSKLTGKVVSFERMESNDHIAYLIRIEE